MILFAIILLLLLLSVFLIDFIPLLYTWQSRIKIGKFYNDVSWNQKVLKKSVAWLRHMPITKIKDSNHLIIFDILQQKYTNNTVQSWQEASLLAGMYADYKKTEQDYLKSEILSFVNKKISENGNWKHQPVEVDACWLGFVFMQIDFVDNQKIKPALDYLYHLVTDRIGEDGTVLYRKSMPNYRYVDTIGFVCPFLIKYGLEFNVPGAVELTLLQIRNYVQYATLENKIPCHAYEINSKAPIGIFGWGRGVAWLVLGILETFKLLPDNHPDKIRLKELLTQLAQTLKNYQNKNGAFSCNILAENSRLDSSATAVFAWLFLEFEMREQALLALNYLKSVTRRNGAVDFSQGDTKGLGNYSRNFDALPFTQGFLLRTIL